MVATDPVTTDLLNARAFSEQRFLQFYKQRLKQSENRVDFFDRLSKQKLKRFSSMIKTKSLTVPDRQEVTVHANSELFSRLLVVAQVRTMNIQSVLQYKLGPLPWSLATPDDSLCKTTKSKLMALLKDGVPAAEEVPPDAAWIVDVTAIPAGHRLSFNDIR